MVDLTLIVVILIAHFIADFVLQTDNMAKGKSTSNGWLFLHVSVYTIVIYCLLRGYTEYIQGTINPTGYLFVWAVFNGLAHFSTDYFTSRWTSSLWKQGRTHDFFVVIGLDQTIHFITLFITAKWLLQG